ncbi:hypothetical protein VPH35_019051 [Triticum aestivum]
MRRSKTPKEYLVGFLLGFFKALYSTAAWVQLALIERPDPTAREVVDFGLASAGRRLAPAKSSSISPLPRRRKAAAAAAVPDRSGGAAEQKRQRCSLQLANRSTEPTHRSSKAGSPFLPQKSKMDNKQKKLLLLLFGPEEN